MNSTSAVVVTLLDIVQTLGFGSWFGCQVYSVTMVQRHPAAERTPRYYEDFTSEMVDGSRWQIVTLLGVTLPALVVSVVLRSLQDPAPPTAWTVVVAVQAALVLVTIGVFVYLSWHVWPLRIFALPSELPAVRRLFYRLSVVVLGLLGSILALVVVGQALA